MRNLPDRRLLIRWMFDALGFLLLFGHEFVVTSILRADFWAQLFFAEESKGYFLFIAAVKLYTVPTALLCWLTASGVKRDKRWARPVGIGTSALLLIGFPWLTIAGALGLYVLLSTSSRPKTAAATPTKPTTDYWNSKRKSKAQVAVLILLWNVGFVVQALLSMYADRVGMPAWHPGWKWWLWFSLFVLLHTALHESGHAIVAWAAGFKISIISVGPFTFWRDHSRFKFRLEPARLFDSGGYMGAIPVFDRNLRRNEIAILAAGPATNAITCLVSLAVFFSLPGTQWQGWWWIPAINAFIAGIMAVGNLIPLGYCDGTMLFHLIFWTPAGRLLLDRKRVVQMGDEAETCHGQAAFFKKIELQQAMLDRSLAFGKDNAFMIAACHQALGSAYVLVDDWPAADLHYRKCLEFEGELAANPGLDANVWSGLHLTSVRRHQVAAVGAAYASTIAILEKQKTSGVDHTGPAVTFAMLAQAHHRNGDFQSALAEVERGLKSVSGDIFLQAHLLRTQAVCRLDLHETDAGLAGARSAADLFRSPEIPPGRRNLAWENVADLGYELWRSGQCGLPVDLLREGIGHLESGGAVPVAAHYRIKLAAILRQLGRPEEAFVELPADEALPPTLRRAFFAERAQVHLISGRPDLAVADCREFVALWRAHPCAPAPEIASAEALLAKACLAAGNLVEAEALALQAADVLGPWQHPDAASCLVTFALVQSQSTGECPSAQIDEAFRLIESDLLLGPPEKARRKAAETARIQQSPATVPVLV